MKLSNLLCDRIVKYGTCLWIYENVSVWHLHSYSNSILGYHTYLVSQSEIFVSVCGSALKSCLSCDIYHGCKYKGEVDAIICVWYCKTYIYLSTVSIGNKVLLLRTEGKEVITCKEKKKIGWVHF